jgi:Spy/CpxP family protein refolding chaperone
MNRTIKTTLTALAIGTLSLSSLAWAGPGHKGDCGGPHGRGPKGPPTALIERHAQELQIPPATVEAMKNAFEAAQPELQALRERAHAARQAERAGTGSAADTQKAFEALRARHEALRTQIHGMLTPDQRARLEKLREQKMQERREGKGRWDRRGDRPEGAAPQGRTGGPTGNAR